MLGVLDGFARDVERQVVGVHQALDEPQPLGDERLAVVGDEHATHEELHVFALLLLLKEVVRRLGGDV